MNRWVSLWLLATLAAVPASGAETQTLPRADARFSKPETQEVPDFRRHVVPMLGKLGCNGRACHGSFQGQGGFRLSLFGYDFEMDHQALTAGDEPRVDLEHPAESLMLEKPTLTIPHEGGERMKVGSWQHRLLVQWIQGGADGVGKEPSELSRLEVTPSELLFSSEGETEQLQVVAVWSDGSREDVTPLCRFQVNDTQIATIDETGLVTAGEPGDSHVVVFYDNGVQPIPVMRPVSDRVGPQYPEVETPTRIDELVVEKLRKLGIVPSELSTDAEFLRRVSLDLTGTLPTAQEVEEFLADASPDKRARKIDELLDRPAYAAWWATRLSDYTGNSAQQLVNVTPVRRRGSEEWYEWIHQRIADNMPYDELVAGIVLATSRNAGESFAEYSKNMSGLYWKDAQSRFADRESLPHYWARRNFRQPEDRVIGFAYTFLGIRIQCAQCHKHPFDQWTQDDFKQFTGFFTGTNFGINPQSRREYRSMMDDLELGNLRGGQARRELARLVQRDKVIPFQEVYSIKPRPGRRMNARARNRRRQPASEAKLLGGATIDLTEYADARIPLMKWLRDPENPYFARAFVNRVWSAYFHIGIVEPPDDLSLANPPSNKRLLDYLTQGFIDSGFDMKWLHREIANSRTYQLSWKPNETNIQDRRNFSRAIPRRLPAEVAYDAIRQATSSDEQIAKMHQDPSDRAIAFNGFVRNQTDYALTIFGRSSRESNCDCDRSSEPSLLQTIYLQNDRELLQMIENRRNGWVAQVGRTLGLEQNSARSTSATDADPPANGRRRAARMRARKRALRDNADEAAARELYRRLVQLVELQEQAGSSARGRQNSPPTSDEESPGLILQRLVRTAYLRTLSRPPKPEELERSRQYLEQAENPAEGLKDLLWALLNTKEFIVNH